MSYSRLPAPAHALLGVLYSILVLPFCCLSLLCAFPASCGRRCIARVCLDPVTMARSRLPLVLRESDQPIIFFDGAGFAIGFSLGVLRWIMGLGLDTSKWNIVSISAGNIAALFLLLDMDPREQMEVHYEEFVLAMRDSSPSLGICGNLSTLGKFLHHILPADAHVRASGRLHVVVSHFPAMHFKFLSRFSCNEELIQAVICSCALPGFVYRPRAHCWPGSSGCYLDAGLTNRATPLDEVSCARKQSPFGARRDFFE